MALQAYESWAIDMRNCLTTMENLQICYVVFPQMNDDCLYAPWWMCTFSCKCSWYSHLSFVSMLYYTRLYSSQKPHERLSLEYDVGCGIWHHSTKAHLFPDLRLHLKSYIVLFDSFQAESCLHGEHLYYTLTSLRSRMWQPKCTWYFRRCINMDPC